MKKYLYISLALLLWLQQSFAGVPDIQCGGLPCPDKTGDNGVFWIIGKLIATGIKYVAVIAVLAVMYGGIMYLISSGEEEKTKKAKSVIIWALLGVFVSVLAWSLINIVNNFILF